MKKSLNWKYNLCKYWVSGKFTRAFSMAGINMCSEESTLTEQKKIWIRKKNAEGEL